MTAIWMHSVCKHFENNEYGTDDGYGCGYIIDETKKSFLFSYSISILTASLGLTKLLLVGPCPILSDKGLLNGLFTWRFFLCFLGVLSSMLTKAFFIVFAIGG